MVNVVISTVSMSSYSTVCVSWLPFRQVFSSSVMTVHRVSVVLGRTATRLSEATCVFLAVGCKSCGAGRCGG